MPILDNSKHEKFAKNLARNVPQGEAYVNAGYTANAGAASRLASSHLVKERTAELRVENNTAVTKFMNNTSLENAQSLKELGLTIEWCATAFKTIYDTSIDQGQLSSANTAVANIQKLVELEQGSKGHDDEDTEGRIKITDVTEMLKAAKELEGARPNYILETPTKVISNE